MKEVILCKYGEVILKGANRSDFEAKMLKQLRQRARRVGNYKIFYSQSTVYIEPLDDDAIDNIDEIWYYIVYDNMRRIGYNGKSKSSIGYGLGLGFREAQKLCSEVKGV